MIQEDKEIVNMKTIEERAWEKYPEVIKHHNLAHIDINEEKRKMYIEIATEQKSIDIKKACEWLYSQMKTLYDDEWYESNIKQWVNELKKAMEE